MQATKPKKMTPQQRKFLLSRLGNRWQSPPDRPMPAAVKKAQAIVAAWDRRERAYQRKKQPEFKEAYDKAHQAVLFASSEEALAAVEAFEAYRKNFS